VSFSAKAGKSVRSGLSIQSLISEHWIALPVRKCAQGGRWHRKNDGRVLGWRYLLEPPLGVGQQM